MLKRWFRRFVEVRDAEGAERCIVSAVRAGADHAQMADMLFAAATDHRYLELGHVLDFTNKAFEALDVAGWSTRNRSCPAWPEHTRAQPAWRNPTPGATRWTWWRSWRTPSSGFRRR